MIDTEELDNDDVKAVHACLNNNKTQLAEHSSHLALCLLQELTKSPDDLSDAMEQFLDQARSPAFNCLLSSKGKVGMVKNTFHLSIYPVSSSHTVIVSTCPPHGQTSY